MREIKFKAWDKERGTMLIGNNGLCMLLTCGVLGWNFANEINILSSYTKQDRYILMQFTGLRDKNGVEIYEGDIVKYEDRDWTVTWEYDRWDMTKGDDGVRYDDLHDDPGFTEWKSCEVIGNIYENPELLNR